MADTIFAKILAGEIPADFVHQDELCVAFSDIAPQAPVHILVIPRKPLKSLPAAAEEDAALLGHLLRVCSKVAPPPGWLKMDIESLQILAKMAAKLWSTCTFMYWAAAA